MKTIATLNKPCTDDERRDFIFYYNQDCKGELGTSYEIQETETALLALGPDEREQRLAEIDKELSEADTLYTTQLDTAIPYTTSVTEEGEEIQHMYKPKWAEETYISLLSAGQLMPSMFPILIWDATELEENAVKMTMEELTKLTTALAAIQQKYFDERKAKKSALLKEKEELEEELNK